jgi:plastocyanin
VLRPILLICLFTLVAAAPASAATTTKTYRYGPIKVAGYEVKQDDLTADIPKPDTDGFITRMSVDVVDKKGKRMGIDRLMLHHIVFSSIGRFGGDKRDRTCNTLTMLDSKTTLPAVAERFYAAGEERAEMELPPGYGYPVRGADRWLMTWMLMNHRAESDEAYVEYKITYDDAPDLQPVSPYWLDVRNCKADPVFDVPGGGKPGSNFATSSTFTMPEGVRIVGGTHHVHGGAKHLKVTQPDCGGRQLMRSDPAWGRATHPFYNVKPVLHEPGPVSMSSTLSAQGFPVAAGERLTLTAVYDNEVPHTRAMGLSVLYAAPDPGVTSRCGPLPADQRVVKTKRPHRTVAPRFTVPLTGLDGKGRAVGIDAPPGRVQQVRSGATIGVRQFAFSRPNVELRQGGKLAWKFSDAELHDVTLASGPRGFSSPHLNDGRTYKRTFGTKGTYRVFCSLHPVRMTQTVRVR